MSSLVPQPPTVYAPSRPGLPAAGISPASPATVDSPQGAVVGTGGAQVTAVVPGAGVPAVTPPVTTPVTNVPPVGTPTTSTAVPRTPGELARTGLETGPLLVLALLLVLLGVLLTRLAIPRAI